MSTASVQGIVAPPVASGKQMEFSSASVEDPREKVTPPNSNKTDFRTLITNSMDEVIKERKAKENGDLSSAKSDAEFLEKLADQTKEKRVPKNQLGKDDFLKLFVTQLQNQNPLNPEADTEMAAKLAQFNGLEQMLNVNKSLEKMLAENNTSRNLQLVNYVGREVTVEGGRIRVKDGKISQSEYKLENDAAQSTLEIRNGSGILVHQIDLGPANAGNHKMQWDGKTPDGKTIADGTYTLSLSARNLDGKNVPVSMTSKVLVTGIDINNKDGGLYSEFGRIKLDQIKSVGLAGFDHNMADAVNTINPAGSGSTPPQALDLGKNVNAPASQDSQLNTADSAKTNANTTEGLERLKAEGKLKLPQNLGDSNPTQATNKPSKKNIDQTGGLSAKIGKETPDNNAPSKAPAVSATPNEAASVL